MFSCEFCKISKITLLYRTLRWLLLMFYRTLMICVRRRNQYFTESRNAISQKEKYIKPLLTHVSNVFLFYKINNVLLDVFQVTKIIQLQLNPNNTTEKLVMSHYWWWYHKLISSYHHPIQKNPIMTEYNTCSGWEMIPTIKNAIQV